MAFAMLASAELLADDLREHALERPVWQLGHHDGEIAGVPGGNWRVREGDDRATRSLGLLNETGRDTTNR